MAGQYYRFVVDDIGIYEVVDRDCPRDDARRMHKPDGSWLHKRGVDFPGSISFWSDEGLRMYRLSGLMDWHVSVVQGNVDVLIIERPNVVLYEDTYQIIVDSDVVENSARVSLDRFLLRDSG